MAIIIAGLPNTKEIKNQILPRVLSSLIEERLKLQAAQRNSISVNSTEIDRRIAMIERQSRKVLPQLGNVKSTWMGRRPTLPDSLPIIGKSQKNNNVIYAFGHQHIGWTLGAVTGKIIDSLSRDHIPNIDISAYSPSRF